jgi:hypothetical protein
MIKAITGLPVDVHFGPDNQSWPDWRQDQALLNEEDTEDALLPVTPPDVIAILGFDPLDFASSNEVEAAHKLQV